jgi:hypothetical protein
MTAATDAYRALLESLDYYRPPCRDDERFIAENTHAGDLAPICSSCEVFDLCEGYARLAKPKAGVWAGRKSGWT